MKNKRLTIIEIAAAIMFLMALGGGTALAVSPTTTDADTTPPSVTLTVVPSIGKSGDPLTVTPSASDDVSGIAEVYYNLFKAGNPNDFVCTLAHDTINGNPTDYSGLRQLPLLPFAGLAVPTGVPCPDSGIAEGTYLIVANFEDGVGNWDGGSDPRNLASYPSNNQPAVFIYDNTPPTISAAATTSPNAAGWYNTDVIVHFTCTDNVGGSGIPSGNCPSDQTLSNEGAAVPSTAQTVTDAAGNTSALSN
ncbi:MAG: hypothetical protein KGJ80_10910, partial [Chloroflexota bacterium]|nr:hypothetical protein [Chloroflexota bacterium]